MRKAGRDGTTHLLLEPAEFLEKLAALTPPAEVHLVLYHIGSGVFGEALAVPGPAAGAATTPSPAEFISGA